MGPSENVLVRVFLGVKFSFTVFDHYGHLRQLSIVSVPRHSPAASSFYNWTHALRGFYEFGSVRLYVRPFFYHSICLKIGSLVFFYILQEV